MHGPRPKLVEGTASSSRISPHRRIVSHCLKRLRPATPAATGACHAAPVTAATSAQSASSTIHVLFFSPFPPFLLSRNAFFAFRRADLSSFIVGRSVQATERRSSYVERRGLQIFTDPFDCCLPNGKNHVDRSCSPSLASHNSLSRHFHLHKQRTSARWLPAAVSPQKKVSTMPREEAQMKRCWLW